MTVRAELRIGDLAERTGVAVSAIRFYESKGLLEPAARVGGQRRYGDDALQKLRFIATLRHAGLSVADVAVALDRDPATAGRRREDASRRAADLREQVATTVSALVVVQHAAHCRRDADDDRCLGDIARHRAAALDHARAMLKRIDHDA